VVFLLEEQLNLARTERPQSLTPALVVAALILVSLILRFYRLGEWNFQATEIFTLRDSVRPQWGNPRPLGYLLNYYLVRPFLPLDEFGLRLVPAIFGVLAIPAVYLVGQRLLSTRAGLFAALLLTFSHLHVSYSQLARYWSLVFFLCAIYPYALYIAAWERNARALLLALTTGALAALAHPVSVLLLMGPALMLATGLRREHITHLWSQRWAKLTAVLLVVIAIVIGLRFIPLLQGWIAQHDRNPGGSQFLHQKLRQGAKQLFYLLGLTEGLTFPIALTGTVGLYLIWRERDKSLAAYLLSLALFPIAFLTLISVRTPVSQYYLVPVLPVFFLAAGAFLDRLFAVDWALRPRWLLPITVLLVIISAGAPSLVSEYMNGRRYDFRSMAHWLQPRITTGDIVYSDQPKVLAHYLPGTPVQHLQADTVSLAQSMAALQKKQSGEALWIVAPSQGHKFRPSLKGGGLIDWMYQRCRLRNTTGKGRVDFRQQYLQIYRCPRARSEALRPGTSPTEAG
jgi:mannosyltransferase